MVSKKFALAAVSAAGVAALTVTLSAQPGAASPSPFGLHARDDAYSVKAGKTLKVNVRKGVLANDSGLPRTFVAHTNTAHGTLNLGVDGDFTYTPDPGFKGTDTFSYGISDAVQRYADDLPPFGTYGGVSLNAGAYGSAVTKVPGTIDQYYGLEDRGPNGTAADGSIVLPEPNYDPAIARFVFVNGKAVLLKTIPLKDKQGHPYSGRVNTSNPTGETAEDLNGNVLAPDVNGYDPEGIVALSDGTFWVSDEYGPFITHFDSRGREIQRLSPIDGSLPKELINRVPNKGMEGLTITPDGSTLVGIMQSALQAPDLGSTSYKKVAITRIVTYNLKSHALHEYLYPLDNPSDTSSAVSEIAALSNTTFVVDERDGNFEPGAYKKFWKIDLTGATDVGPSSAVPGAVYDASKGGLVVNGKSLEATVGKQDTATATATLAADGVTLPGKSLFLDFAGFVTQLDPTGGFFGHDKVEGVYALNGGKQIVVSNDSDFGLGGIVNDTPPYAVTPKLLPATGQQDNGEYLVIDMAKVHDPASTATVTITVK